MADGNDAHENDDINDQHLQELLDERNRLGEAFPETLKLLNKEIERLETGFDTEKFIELHQNPTKVEFRVRLPVNDFPQANFVGRIVGQNGATIKELQAVSGVRLAVFGRGSIRDKTKEEEFRKLGGKYAHLNHDLHVHLYATGNAVSCYKRIALAMEMIEPYLSPDYRDDGQVGRGQSSFGISRGRGGGPLMRGIPRGAPSGWPGARGLGMKRGMPPMVPRGRGQSGRGQAGRGQSSRGMSGLTASRGLRGAGGRGSASSLERGSGRGRGGGSGRGGALSRSLPVRQQSQAEYATDSYEYEGTSAYASDASYADTSAYETADASDAYDEYAQGDGYDSYSGAWGDDSVQQSGYGKMSAGRSTSGAYRSHPY